MSTHVTPHPVLHHVTLKTNRVDEMVRWYGITVGVTTNHHSRFGAWMTNDDANHRIALLAHPALNDDPDKISPYGHAPHRVRVRRRRPTAGHLRPTQGTLILPDACLDHGF